MKNQGHGARLAANLRRTAGIWLLGGLPAGLLSGASLVQLPYLNDFESTDGYALGGVGTEQDWHFDAGLGLEVVSVSISGSQALVFSGSGWLSLDADPAGAVTGYPVTWLDFYMKPVYAGLADLPEYSAQAGVSAGLGFVSATATGEVYALDGDGGGTGLWLPSGSTTSLTGNQATNWLRLTYRLDYVSRQWDLYVNGQLVLTDLGFVDQTLSAFEGVSFLGAAEDTYLDGFLAGTDNPLFADSAGDGLPDAWLIAHGLSTAFNQRYGDPDHDGVPNILEYRLGLNPVDFDTDSDGVWDLREILRGNNPAVADAYTLGTVPFADGFEADADGPLANGTRLWQIQTGTGGSIAVATAADSPEGARQLVLTGTDTSLSREFASTGQPVVWVDFQLRPQGKAAPLEDLPRDIAAMFYFAEDGTLMALNGNAQAGGSWLSLDQIADLGTAFHRITLRLDYAAQTWSLWLDDVRKGQNLGFANPVPYFSGFALTNSASQSAGLDAFAAAVTEPAALDNDGDGLPNTWETAYGLNPDNPSDATLSLSGDGWTNAEKYELGVSPAVSNLSVLPFYEPFEALSAGSLTQGARNWFYLGDAIPQVQSTEVGEGTQALSILPSENGVRVVNHIDGSGHAVLWTQIKLKAVPYPTGAAPELAPTVTAGLFFVQGGDLRVYDGPATGWRTLTLGADLDAWHTVTLRHDYTTQRWSVWVDGTAVAENLGFAHTVTGYSQLAIEGGADVPTYADGIRVQANLPLVLDPVVIPEWWRLQYFGTTAVDPAADPDGDGLGNLDEYLQGHIPTIADDVTAGSGSTLYVNNAAGSDSSYNGLSASPGLPATGYGPKASLGAALGASGASARIIMTSGAAVYTESTIPLTGKNIVLRPYGDVHITHP